METKCKWGETALKSSKSGATPILVATDVASRGLDISHVSHVINFDLLKDIDDPVSDKSGAATAFFSGKNMPLAKALAELMKEANQEVLSWLSQYAENSCYASGGGRTKRYGGGKYGSYDYRSNGQMYNENSYSAPSNEAAGYDVASEGYEFGHESIVASGWD